MVDKVGDVHRRRQPGAALAPSELLRPFKLKIQSLTLAFASMYPPKSSSVALRRAQKGPDNNNYQNGGKIKEDRCPRA